MKGFTNSSAPLIHRIQNSNDLIELIMIVDALKRSGVQTLPHLIIPYLPYARQDRVAAEGDPHALAVFCRMIDGLGFQSVTVIDAHSTVAEAVFDKTRFHSSSPEEFINVFTDRASCLTNNGTYLIAPDEGSIKKTEHYAKIFKEYVKGIIYCAKTRDPGTGAINGFKVANAPLCLSGEANATMLLCDDICDGGGTFIGLAKVLKQQYSTPKLNLFCTHGIFSKGVEPLLAEFEHVGCSDSFLSKAVIGKLEQPASHVGDRFHVIPMVDCFGVSARLGRKA